MRCQNSLILYIVAVLVIADFGVELVILWRTGQPLTRNEMRIAALAGLFSLARPGQNPPPREDAEE
jgi:hypothetical protein